MTDSIGFFPQMIITGICIINLLLIAMSRELQERQDRPVVQRTTFPQAQVTPRKPLTPPTPTSRSGSVQISLYEANKLLRQLQGQYVFPPVNYSVLHASDSPKKAAESHRRVRTSAAAALVNTRYGICSV